MAIIVSECLLGVACRYDGQSKGIDEIIELAKNEKVIPFCPEAPMFGTPRPRIDVIEKEENVILIRQSDGLDVTECIVQYTEEFLQKYPHVKRAILKSKSPSCGCGTTPIYNDHKHLVRYGNGIAAECFLHYGIEIQDENQYIKEKEC